MIKKVTHKSQYLQLIFGLMLIFLVLPAKQCWAESNSTVSQEASKLKHSVSKLEDKLKGEHHPNNNEGDAADIVEVIVSDTPLMIPQTFKDAVTKLGGKFIIIGDGKTVRLLSLDGIYFNPCFSESSGKIDMSVFNEASHTCKFAGRLGETNMLMAQKFGHGGGGGSGCGTCTGDNATQVCKKSTDKYGSGCSGGNKSCDSNC